MPEAAVATPPAAQPPTPPATAPASPPSHLGEASVAQRISQRVFKAKEPEPAPKPAPVKEPPPEKKAEVPETPEVPEIPPETTPEAPKPEEKAGEKPVPQEKVKKTPWQLVHERDARIKELDAKLKELESKPVEEHPKYKELAASVEASKKQAEEALEKLKFRAYEDHPEFKDNYVKPYESAWQAGRQRISSLTLTDPNTGESRKGTADDFDSLYQLRQSDPDKAAQLMGEMFGVKAAAVEGQMLAVDERLNAMQSAREKFRTEGMAKLKQEQESQATAMKQLGETINKTYQTYYEAISKQFPDLFNPVEGDEKGNEALKVGYETATKAFSNLNPFNPKLTAEQRDEMLRLHAETLHFAAASRRLIQWRKQDQATIAALKAKIAEYEKSEPTTGDGGKPVPQELDAPKRVEQKLRRYRA